MAVKRLLFLSTALLLLWTVDALRFRGEPNTYARFPIWNACINASVSFEFKTTQLDGLLMYTDNNGRYDFFEVMVKDGSVRLRLNVIDEQDGSVEIILGNNLNDNRWHSVEVKRKHFETILQVDGTSSSKVAFGSDSTVFRNRNKNNYVYFGGVPLGYRRDSRGSQQDETVSDLKFEGDLRNILYFNCTCIPERAEVIDYRGVSREPRETCEIDNRCPDDCPCVSVEGDSGCECKFKEACIADLYTRYHLPMDRLSGNGLVNPSGMDSIVHGRPQLVPGVIQEALELDSRRQYARIAGPSHRAECFGDLSKCPDGYYLSMWLQFKDAMDTKAVYMSNGGERTDSHGIAMTYGNGILEFIFKHPDGRTWRVKDRNLLPKRWYHVAASWSEDHGLHLFANGRQVNHDDRPSRGTPSTRSAFNDFILGKANDNPRTDRLGRIMVDDFHFISGFRNAKEVRESGPIFHYYIPMNNMTGDRIIVNHINARAYNGATLHDEGVLGKALRLAGNGQYVDLGNFPGTCVGDLIKCTHGITMSFWAKFNRIEGDTRYLFSSPNGISVYYSGNRLYADAHMGDRNWAAYYTGIRPNEWYFIEVSWNPELGLTIYVNEERVAFQPRDSHRGVGRRDNRILIGKEAVSTSLTPKETAVALIDEVDIYYADREKLVNLGLITTGRPVPYHFDMERIQGNRLVHDSVLVDLKGNPRLVPGKIGKALELQGSRQSADFGQHNQICFGNLDYCQNGALFSFWIKPNKLSKNTYFASTGSNGFTLYYKNRRLHAMAQTSTRTWEASTGNLVLNKWQFVEASWHPETGLKLYVNNEMADADETHSARDQGDRPAGDDDEVYLGRGNVDMDRNTYANALFDEIDYWYADRDYLSAHNYIQRGKPKHFIIDFEEIDGIRLVNPTLPIRVVEDPKLIPGKIGNALQLSGNRQYLDISGRQNECLGNLAHCWQGITISAWMRFKSFQNNMVFLSTGTRGILMSYRDGYIYVTADSRSQVTVPGLETNRWYYFEISWHPSHGLQVYVDTYLEGSAPSAPLREATDQRYGSFYIGRPNTGDTPGGLFAFGDFDVDEMEIWYGRRDDLLAFGYIGRGMYIFHRWVQDNYY